MQAPNRLYKSEVRGSVSRVKTPCEKGLPHCTYVLKAEQRLTHATEKEKRSFPMERGPTAKHHPAWNPQCMQWFRAVEFQLLCSTPKVMPRFSLGDVGEARWSLSHRWTDTNPILPAARGSSQLAASAESLITDAERSNRRVACLLHIISDVTRVRHAQGTTLSILHAFIAFFCCCCTAVLVLYGPSCLFGAL